MEVKADGRPRATGGRRGLVERLGSRIFGTDGHDGRALSPDQWAYRWTRWIPLNLRPLGATRQSRSGRADAPGDR